MKDSLEYRSVPLRVGQVEDPLGPGRHGSIQAPDHCFGVHAGVSRWVRTLSHFNRAVRGHRGLPKYLSSDHDPLYSFTNGKPICGSWRREKSRASPTFPCPIRSWKGSSVRFDANIWIIRCSGRVQIWKINCWISRPITTTIAPITHGKGERRIRPRHTLSQICARFAGNLTVQAYTRHP